MYLKHFMFLVYDKKKLSLTDFAGIEISKFYNAIRTIRSLWKLFQVNALKRGYQQPKITFLDPSVTLYSDIGII